MKILSMATVLVSTLASFTVIGATTADVAKRSRASRRDRKASKDCAAVNFLGLFASRLRTL
jgi:hypothetical protein